MLQRQSIKSSIFLALLISIILGMTVILTWNLFIPFYPLNSSKNINGERALQDVMAQLNMGPRIPGSLAHARFLSWLQTELKQADWQVKLQTGEFMGQTIKNIIAQNSKEPPQIIIATHYDSRLSADNDPVEYQRTQPVPGANDGASGVAVLLELARALQIKEKSIWLVFLDAEDNGNIPGWEWLLGSRYFVSKLETKPEAVVILDMIGDEDLNIFIERNSNTELVNQIWATAKSLGYEDFFINTPKYAMIDDHIPFIEAGIPAVVVIDFDYPYWHTTSDTLDKVSALSLQITGDTIFNWIIQQE
jgi:glutaminyl-peptide cyclotransferase